MSYRCIYHRYEVSRDLPDAQIEVCVRCSKKVIYPKRDGRMDNGKYLKDHIADTAQPFGRTAKIYAQVYGSKGLQIARKHRETLRGIKSKEQVELDWEQAHKDAKRDMRTRDDYGKKMIFT